jgi:hypothetical protein
MGTWVMITATWYNRRNRAGLVGAAIGDMRRRIMDGRGWLTCFTIFGTRLAVRETGVRFVPLKANEHCQSEHLPYFLERPMKISD